MSMATVLIVEPDTEARLSLARTLYRAGHIVIGRLGVSQVSGLDLEQLVDLVMIGAGIPSIRRVELLRSLSEDPLTTAIPVVVMGVTDDYGDAATACAFGAADYICQTLCQEEIALRVNQALHAAAQADRNWLAHAMRAATNVSSPPL